MPKTSPTCLGSPFSCWCSLKPKSFNSIKSTLSIFFFQFSIQFSCSVVSDSATPLTAAHQASLSITNFWSLFKLVSVESVMPPNHLILCCSLLLPSVFPSISVFSNESVLHIRWPNNRNFSFRISPSNEYYGLICFRIHWFDLFAVQGTLKGLL